MFEVMTTGLEEVAARAGKRVMASTYNLHAERAARRALQGNEEIKRREAQGKKVSQGLVQRTMADAGYSQTLLDARKGLGEQASLDSASRPVAQAQEVVKELQAKVQEGKAGKKADSKKVENPNPNSKMKNPLKTNLKSKTNPQLPETAEAA